MRAITETNAILDHYQYITYLTIIYNSFVCLYVNTLNPSQTDGGIAGGIFTKLSGID